MTHPIVAAAAAGELPHWARLGEWRRQHVTRVAQLLDDWARTSAPEQVTQWRAAGYLHDCLRDAAPAELRAVLGGTCADWPDALLHAPAAAARLQAEGVNDRALLHAIRFHPIGHAGFDSIGRALYLADFMEPGRDFASEWLAALRARMPQELPAVLAEVTAARIRHQLDGGRAIRTETVEFWNAQVNGYA